MNLFEELRSHTARSWDDKKCLTTMRNIVDRYYRSYYERLIKEMSERKAKEIAAEIEEQANEGSLNQFGCPKPNFKYIDERIAITRSNIDGLRELQLYIDQHIEQI